METTALSGAIDEIEARQLDSLAQQAAGRTHYSWVIPFADQHPVFIELEHNDGSDAEGTLAQESWTVDLEVGLTETVSMAANVRVDHEGVMALRLLVARADVLSFSRSRKNRAGRDAQRPRLKFGWTDHLSGGA